MTKFSQIQEAINNAALALKAADRLKYGSFSDRNPALGKMVRCVFCRRRKRQNDACCSGKLLDGAYTNRKGQIVTPTVSEPVAPPIHKRKNPRLTRKNPPLFLVHQLLVEIESGTRPELENVAEKNLARYVEKIVLDGKKEKARQKRNQQKISRRVNRSGN